MLKWIGLMFLGAIFITGSLYRWDRVSDPGVLTQETCADRNVPGCKNPEDFKDSIVVDSVTGDTTVVSSEMFKGSPNGMGWIWFIVGGVALFYGGYRLVQEVRARNKNRPDKPRPLVSPALLFLQYDTVQSFTGPPDGGFDWGTLGVAVGIALAVIIFVAVARHKNPRYPNVKVQR